MLERRSRTVSRILFLPGTAARADVRAHKGAVRETIIPLGDALPRRSSNLPASSGWFGRKRPNLYSPPGRIGPIRSCPLESAGAIPAYLVLLRVGFTMRRSLLPARCALTAPFHPYLRFLAVALAVCFLLHWPSSRLEAAVPDVIRHTALRSPDFPPPRDAPASPRGSDHPAACWVSVSASRK